MILDPILDLFRGRAITVPPLDGAFRPNRFLDEAPVLAGLPEPDALASDGARLFASSGNAVFAIAPRGAPTVAERFAAPVTALALSPSDEIAAGLETGQLIVGGAAQALPEQVRCITALAFAPDGTLWLAVGSARHAPSAWARDLLEGGASGSVWKRGPGGDAFQRVAGELAFPCGLLPQDGGGAVVSESWRHRLLRLDAAGRQTVVLGDLPGYPARLSPAKDGGAWLSLFAPRNRLVEFVLGERHYRKDMLAEVAPEFWIAPALSTRSSFLEPLQCGGIRTMGVHKPWSPTRSYGLAAKLDANLRPTASLHSRADGRRHGTTDAVEHAGMLVVASKGGDCLLGIGLTRTDAAGTVSWASGREFEDEAQGA